MCGKLALNPTPNNSCNRRADCVAFIIALLSKVECCMPRPVNSSVGRFLSADVSNM
jgi:hypothetical protein